MKERKSHLGILALILILFSPSILFATMPNECPSDCPNTGYYFPPSCPFPYGNNNSYGSSSRNHVAMRSVSFGPPSPSNLRGSDAYSRTATIPSAGSSIFQDVSIGKKSLAEKETLLNFGGKGAIPLEINLYYSGMRIDYTENQNGNTHLGPGWVLNYEMSLMDITDSDDFTFRTSTGDLHRIIKIGTNSWKSRWYWIPLTVSMTKVENDPVYSILYKMLFDDNKTEYGFRQYGQLVYQKDADGNMLKFTYDSTYKKLTRIDFDHVSNDTDNRYVTFSHTNYDSKTRLTEITSSDGRKWFLEYDTTTKRRLIRIKYQKTSSSTLYTLREYSYSDQNNYWISEIKATDGEGNFSTTSSYEYNGSCFVTKKKDPSQNDLVEASYFYNDATIDFPSGLMVKTYNEIGRQTKKFEYYIDDELMATREYSYRRIDADPNNSYMTMFATKTTDAAESETNYEYNGPTITTPDDPDYWEKLLDFNHTRLKKITYPDSSFITYTYDTNGNVTSFKDNRGKITNYAYDSNNHLTSVTNPLNQTISYTYNTFGLLSTETHPTNRATTYSYDNYGKIKAITDADNLATKYQYDTYGNLACITDTNNRATKYQDYNDFCQVGKIIDSEGGETIITYNSAGLKSSVQDPKGNDTYFYYDKNYRLVDVKNAKNDSVYYTYNSIGNMTKFTDARAKETNYAYDEFNRIYTETDPLNKRITYTYSAGGCSSCGDLGALASKTDAMGVITEYEYNNRGRPDKIIYPSDEYVTFTYDYNGNRLAMYDTRLDIGNGTFSWEYDYLNRVTKETYPDSEYISYTYNTFGARSQMRLPNGSTQTYSYDSRQRLSTIAHSVGPKTFTYSYNTDNALKSVVYPNTMVNRFTYDTLYRLSNVSGVMYEEPEEMYYSIAYQYDANGNRIRAAWDSDEGINTFLYTKNYSYDSLNQLLSEKKLNQAETFRLYEYQYLFDAAGNRTQMKYYDGSTTQTTTYQYNNGNQMRNRYKGTDEWEYSYDNNGNMKNETLVESGSQREFTWNEDNRLAYAQNLVDSQVAEYTYDAMGRRIRRFDENCSTYTYYYYDGLTVIAEKMQEGGDDPFWYRISTVGPGVIGNIFRISYRNGNSWSDAYYHYDAIGNVVMITDSSGSVASSIEQEAYGNVKVGSQSGYHLTTKEYDSNPELYYFWQRWYDQLVGRFLSISSYPPNIEHPYMFVENNTLKRLDPEGSKTIEECEHDYNLCIDDCRRIRGRMADVRRAICYAECMAVYSGCLATAEETLEFVGTVLIIGGTIYVTVEACEGLLVVAVVL